MCNPKSGGEGDMPDVSRWVYRCADNTCVQQRFDYSVISHRFNLISRIALPSYWDVLFASSGVSLCLSLLNFSHLPVCLCLIILCLSLTQPWLNEADIYQYKTLKAVWKMFDSIVILLAENITLQWPVLICKWCKWGNTCKYLQISSPVFFLSCVRMSF